MKSIKLNIFILFSIFSLAIFANPEDEYEYSNLEDTKEVAGINEYQFIKITQKAHLNGTHFYVQHFLKNEPWRLNGRIFANTDIDKDPEITYLDINSDVEGQGIGSLLLQTMKRELFRVYPKVERINYNAAKMPFKNPIYQEAVVAFFEKNGAQKDEEVHGLLGDGLMMYFTRN